MANEHNTRWERVAAILQAIGGLLMPLAVAFLGLVASYSLEKSKAQDAKLTLYTELMSHREQSDTTLREDMFKSIVGVFLTPSTAKLDQKVLSLELLAYNFHESLELGPLFKDVLRDIDASSSPKNGEYRARLESVAHEVALKQLEILHEGGMLRESGINLEDLAAHPEGIKIFDECFPVHSEDASIEDQSPTGEAAGRPRCVRVSVMDVDRKLQGLRVRIESRTPEGENVDQLFWVDFFDLPMVDNTHLSHDQRLAVVLRNFTKTSAQLAFVYFPGSHAGIKDKPFYDDMLHQLALVKEPEHESGQHP